MFTSGSGENGLAILCDTRTSYDVKMGGVLDYWGFGNGALGRDNWRKTLRIAIRESGQQPLNAKELKKLRPELDELLINHNIKALLVLEAPKVRGFKKKNNGWALVGFKGNPVSWAGTVIERDGLFICPVLNYYNHEYVYAWLAKRQFIQALEVAKGRMRPMPWPHLISEPGYEMLEALRSLYYSEELIIDIETNMAKTIFTAIGVGNSEVGISVPWDSFQISGKDEWEPGIDDYDLGAEIKAELLSLLANKAPKVGHNFGFDLYQLGLRGHEINGEVHDTILMSHSIFNQYRKSLQRAVAIKLCVEPWKSLHKPVRPKKKLAGYDEWTSTPKETRVYNAKDVVATARLRKALTKNLA